MTAFPLEFRDINFFSQRDSHVFDLLPEKKSSPTIFINGHLYLIIAAKNDLPIVKEALKRASLYNVYSTKELIRRLSKVTLSPSFKAIIRQREIEIQRTTKIKSPTSRREYIINTLSHYSFRYQLYDYQCLHKFGKGEVLIIVGTSTSGKSSIIEAYKQKHPEFLEEGIDKTIFQQLTQQIQQQYPTEFGILNNNLETNLYKTNILNAALVPQIPLPFKKGVTPEDEVNTRNAAMKIKNEFVINLQVDPLEALLYKNVFRNSHKGKLTIFDVTRIEGLFQEVMANNIHLPLRIALVYCPFSKLSERMEFRNKEAMENRNPINTRIGIFPLLQFAQLYRAKKNDNEIVLETLHRSVVIDILQKNFHQFIEKNRNNPKDFSSLVLRLKKSHGEHLSENELFQKEESLQLNELLKKLGFISDQVNSVELTPRFKHYDYLLDSSLLSPEQSVQLFQ